MIRSSFAILAAVAFSVASADEVLVRSTAYVEGTDLAYWTEYPDVGERDYMLLDPMPPCNVPRYTVDTRGERGVACKMVDGKVVQNVTALHFSRFGTYRASDRWLKSDSTLVDRFHRTGEGLACVELISLHVDRTAEGTGLWADYGIWDASGTVLEASLTPLHAEPGDWNGESSQLTEAGFTELAKVLVNRHGQWPEIGVATADRLGETEQAFTARIDQETGRVTSYTSVDVNAFVSRFAPRWWTSGH